MLTNISEEMMEAGKLFKLYGVRWQIEITFRAWKQSSHFKAAFDWRSKQTEEIKPSFTFESPQLL